MEQIERWIELVSGRLGSWHGVLVFILIVMVAYAVDWICRRGIVRIIRKLTERTKASWDDLLFNDKVMNSLCHIVPPVVFYFLIPLAFPGNPEALLFVFKICKVYIVAVSLRFLSVFFNSLFVLTNRKAEFRDRPLKGVYQIIQVALFFIGGILIIAILVGEPLLNLLAGLGASAAILMLVFKDTIMGLVSGIQLSANDMLRPGDWITMPKYNADGVVVEVTLNTVKVRNFDNTIVTVPPYALVSDSFQNWRGMQESGGRRVKRSVNIDMTSVRFCTHEMLEKYKKILLLRTYVEETEDRIDRYNKEHGVDESILVNGLHQTNLGVFRAYLERYLSTLPAVNKEMTYMVRQLQPTEKGIPLEIYFFSVEKDWVSYEKVQADVFDHVLAVIPEFDLCVFQNPSGTDIENAVRSLH